MVKERKSKFILTGKLRLTGGLRLISPSGQLARPTTGLVREALMNILRERLKDSNWLDLYSGSGIISCEAIEKGAKTVLAVELNRKMFKTCISNLEIISSTTNTKVFINAINTEAIRFLGEGYKKYSKETYKKLGQKAKRFNYIYIDPPYKEGKYFQALESLLDGDWVAKDCLAICEFSITHGINLPKRWQIKDKKKYGNTGLLFLTPNQA